MSHRAHTSIRRAAILTLAAAFACGDGPTDPGPPPPPEPRLESVEIVEGDDQAGSVGLPLDTLIVLQALNDDGSAATGLTLALAASGDGAVDAATATTDADGRATVEWTLATAPGPNTLDVTPQGQDTAFATVVASGLADIPAGMAVLDGNQQSELAGLPVPAPIRVRVVDQFDNPVVGVPVRFSTEDGGTLTPAEDSTDLDGVASATWTLGPATGPQSARALVPDSAVMDIVDLPGSPASFTATAVDFALDSVTPEPATVGDTLSLEGTGFAPDLGGNQVTIDGEVATVLDVTQTSITVRVPSYGCVPAQNRRLVVTRGTDSAAVELAVYPVDALALAAGDQRVIRDPADYCLQFLAGAPDSVEYLLGLTSTRAWNASASFTITGRDTSTTAAALASALAPASATMGATEPTSPEAVLREWERSFLSGGPRIAASSDGSGDLTSGTGWVAAAVGDHVSFRVPYVHTDPCNDYATQPATVVFEGPRLVVAVPEVPDLLLSTLLGSAIFQNAVSSAAQVFQGAIYQRVTEYVGSLDAADADGRTTVLLTPALAGADVPPAFATAVDLVDRATCPSSDEQVIVYVNTPPLDYSQLSTTISTIVDLLEASRPGIAHELTHVAQTVKRIGSGITQPLPSWLGEGQAELLVEVVGRTLRGDAPGMDYGASVVTADPLATRWYRPRFQRLSYYFGWNGGSGRVAGAPEQCSLFGFGGMGSACEPEAGPGAAWSFARYLSDRVGPDFAGGEAELNRALALLPEPEALDTLLVTTTGSDLAAVMVDWAATLYVDGRLAGGTAPELSISSWNLADIYAALPAEQRLDPASIAFQPFTLSGSVVGGGTAYLRLRGSGTHGSLAVSLRDALGSPLGTDLGTRLWVVRVR